MAVPACEDSCCTRQCLRRLVLYTSLPASTCAVHDIACVDLYCTRQCLRRLMLYTSLPASTCAVHGSACEDLCCTRQCLRRLVLYTVVQQHYMIQQSSCDADLTSVAKELSATPLQQMKLSSYFVKVVHSCCVK